MRQGTKNLLTFVGELTLITTVAVGIMDRATTVTRNQCDMNAMPKMQPWIWRYDKNSDRVLSENYQAGVETDCTDEILANYDRESIQEKI